MLPDGIKGKPRLDRLLELAAVPDNAIQPGPGLTPSRALARR